MTLGGGIRVFAGNRYNSGHTEKANSDNLGIDIFRVNSVLHQLWLALVWNSDSVRLGSNPGQILLVQWAPSRHD